MPKSNPPLLPFRKTLTWKAVRIVFAVSAIGTVIHFFLLFVLSQLFFDKVEQAADWEVARSFAAALEPLTSVNAASSEVQEKIFELQRFNPRVDISLLDSDGTLLSPPAGKKLPLEPVRKFLGTSGLPSLPIYGEVHEGLRPYGRFQPISAAPINIEGRNGFVYVVLSGRRYQAARRMLGDFIVTALTGLFLLLIVLFATVLAAFLFSAATNRFRLLTEGIGRFSTGDYSVRIPEETDDEVGLHIKTFNEMAAVIQRHIEALQENDRLRRELIANVSHDLRTPVASMHTLLEALHGRYEEMSGEQRESFLERLLISSRDLGCLVDDLFELSKLNAFSGGINLEIVELRDLLLEIIKKSVTAAEAKDLGLMFDVPKGFPPVIAERRMLDRLISNLVQNAIRYSKPGGDIRIFAHESGGQKVAVSVADNGIGIPKDELPAVFDRFFRGSRAKEREQSGSGLGLAIAKRIVELHGQEIRAESEEGLGSTFTFTLEKAQPER